MRESFKEIELTAREKKAILDYAGFVILEQRTLDELSQKRKSNICFVAGDIELVTAELIHHCRSIYDDTAMAFFSELIDHLENYS